MDDWSYREIIEVSSVIVSFFAPVIIALLLFFLVNAVILQIQEYNTAPSGRTLLNVVLSILSIAFLSYAEIRLLRWLTK
jgi:hypothetical protein